MISNKLAALIASESAVGVVPPGKSVPTEDDCIRKNPFDFHINTVIEDDTEPKVPLSPNQEKSLLFFCEKR